MTATSRVIAVFFLLVSAVTFGQVTFQTELSKKNMGINQRIEVRFTMNEDGDNFTPPSFDNFTVVGGPMQSYSTTWINGNRSFKKSYSYYVTPKKKGTLTIGSASIEINDKTYKTQPVTVTVGDAVQEDPRQQQRNQGWGSFFGDDEPQRQQINTANIGKGIHLVAEVSNSNPYINEPITVVYKLYVSHESGIRGMQLTNTPKFTNFWNHTLSEKDMQVKIEKYKGKEFRMALIQRTVLLPQKDGKLTIDPLEFDMVVEEATGRYDFFGRPEVNVSNKKFSTGAKVINVKPLPLDTQPADFTGAVGHFSFTATINKTQVKANESVELTVTASGKGNFQLFTLPKPVAPSALELYDPELKENISNDISSGMQGSKSEKYVIVPQYKGQYTIKPITFSYFDPSSKTYKTITTKEIVVDVTEGPELPTNEPDKKEIKNSDVFQDILPEASFVQNKKADDFLGTELFYALLFSPVVLLPVIVLATKKRRRHLQDVTGARIRRNQKLAKKYLGEAKRKMGNKEAFYEALERCLHNFLKARLHIETSEMSNENIQQLLEEKQIPPDTVKAFTDVKTTCEMARYSPFDIHSMKNDFNRAVNVISDLEKQFKA